MAEAAWATQIKNANLAILCAFKAQTHNSGISQFCLNAAETGAQAMGVMPLFARVIQRWCINKQVA